MTTGTDWQPSRWVAIGSLTLLAVAASWALSSGFPSGNNLYHVPLVLDYAGSVEGPHDLFHRSLAHFISFFWSAVALVATEANIRPLFLGLLLTATVATVLAAYQVAVMAGSRRDIAVVGCGVLAFGFGSRGIFELGGGELLAQSLTHSQIATALCLAAVALAVRRRWIVASLVCGVAADINLFLGFWTMLNVAAARALLDFEERRALDYRSYAAMGIGCLALTAPTLVWALSASRVPAGLTFSYPDFLEAYHPYHFFVHHEIWLFAAQIGLLLTVWVATAAIARTDGLRVLGALALGAAATLSVGAAVAYLTDSPLYLNLHPLRYAAVAYWIAALGTIALWSATVAGNPQRQALGGLAALGFLLPTPAVSVVALILMTDPQRLSRPKSIVLYVALLSALLVAPFSDGRFDFPLWLRIGPVPVMALVCVGAAAFISEPRARSLRERLLLLALVGLVAGSTLAGQPAIAVPLALVIAALTFELHRGTHGPLALALATGGAACLAAIAMLDPDVRGKLLSSLALLSILTAALLAPRGRVQLRTPLLIGLCVVVVAALGLVRAPRSGFDFPRWDKDEAWFDAQAWARANTPPDTVFYAPDRFGFAALSRRPVWWDANQGAAVMWEPGYYPEWETRRNLARAARGLADLVRLARDEQFRYLVLECAGFESTPDPRISIRYRNDHYCIGEVAAPIG